MAGLLERISDARAGGRASSESRYAIDTWISQYLIPASWQQFTYGNVNYPLGMDGSLGGNRRQEIAATIDGYLGALRACPPAFAAEMVRAACLSQARFCFRNPPWHWTNPRRQFTSSALRVLEQPWPNGTTGELLSRMEWHAGLAGNAFVFRAPDRLRVLRPDWTAILYGSQTEPEDPTGALDAQLVGYVYANRGVGQGKPQTILPADMAHWSPVPDPEKLGLGMSWLTPAIREMQNDRMATEHKIRYWEHGATPNLVVKGIPALSKEQFDQLVQDMEDTHGGVRNAYRTLYLTAGADASVIGSNLKDLDLENVQGAGETRISILSRVPAALLGISKGLTGSSLNAGNLAMTRRIFSDTWVYPTLQDLARSLSPLVAVPADAELWYDTGDMPIMREDALDAANIESVKATTITGYVKEGFTPESAIAATVGQDVTLLEHTGLVSVQLQPPGALLPGTPGAAPPAITPAAEPQALPAGKTPPAADGGTSGSGN